MEETECKIHRDLWEVPVSPLPYGPVVVSKNFIRVKKDKVSYNRGIVLSTSERNFKRNYRSGDVLYLHNILLFQIFMIVFYSALTYIPCHLIGLRDIELQKTFTSECHSENLSVSILKSFSCIKST